MEENITGVNESIETSLPQEAAAEVDVVELSDLAAEIEAGNPAETVEETPTEDAPAAEKGDDGPVKADEAANQARINAAFSQRLNAERRKFEKDPIYQLGKQYAARFKSTEEAQEQLLSERAEQLAQDPKAFAMEFLRKGEQPSVEPEPSAPADPRASIPDIVNGLVSMEERGELPKDFNIQEYLEAYPDFIADYQQYGLKAAVKMAHLAVQNEKAARTSAKMERNARLPQSTRPASANRDAGPDFANMSSEQFKAYEARINQAMLAGKRVKF